MSGKGKTRDREIRGREKKWCQSRKRNLESGIMADCVCFQWTFKPMQLKHLCFDQGSLIHQFYELKKLYRVCVGKKTQLFLFSALITCLQTLYSVCDNRF